MLVVGRKPFLESGTPKLTTLAGAFQSFIKAGFQPEYFALLGFPIGAAVAAKALTTNKVVSGSLEKSSGENQGVPSGITELIANDTGQTDLVDFQYFAFNILALAYFFVAFATLTADDPKAGLPTIPATLLALSGVSTTAYLFKKAAETGVAPKISSVTPLRVVLGQDKSIRIVGTGFLGKEEKRTAANQVLLDGKALTVEDDDWKDSRIDAQLPKGVTRKDFEDRGWRDRKDSNLADLVVRDDVGNSSPAIQMEVALPPQA